MELNASHWMMIVGALLVVAVLLDGYRRMRAHQQGDLRISLKKEESSIDAGFEPELPVGKPRVVSKGANQDADTRPIEELDPLFDDIPMDSPLRADPEPVKKAP